MFAEDSDTGNSMFTPPFAPKGSMTGPLVNSSSQILADDDVNWLYGFGSQNTAPGKGYVSNLRSFVCPTTRNNPRDNYFDNYNPPGTLEVVKFLVDLKNKAKDKDASDGHSYEVFGTWHRYDLQPNPPRRTLNNVLTYRNAIYDIGDAPGPTKIFTLMDRLEVHGGINNENAPNPMDGHGLNGANVGFTDGHAAFVTYSRWTDVYLTSQDDSNALNGRTK